MTRTCHLRGLHGRKHLDAVVVVELPLHPLLLRPLTKLRPVVATSSSIQKILSKRRNQRIQIISLVVVQLIKVSNAVFARLFSLPNLKFTIY
jgi:hypothetical protein